MSYGHSFSCLSLHCSGNCRGSPTFFDRFHYLSKSVSFQFSNRNSLLFLRGMDIAHGQLLTVTVTAAEVAVLLEVSVATAVSVCDPLVAVVLFQLA